MRKPGLLGLILRAALALGLLGIAIAVNRDEIRGVFLRRPEPLPFLRGLGLYLAGLMLAFLRWYMLVRALGLPFRYRDAVRLGFIGAFFNFVIPGAVFGNVVKAAFLAREHPENRPPAIASVVVDFLCGLLGLFLLAAIAGTLPGNRLDPRLRPVILSAWIAAGAASLALVSAFRKRKPKHRLAGAGAFRSRLHVVLLAVVMGATTHALFILAFHSASVGLFGATKVPGLAEHFLIVPLVLFTTAVPLPFGALGVSEAASGSLFGIVKYSGGAVAMLGFRLYLLAGAAIGAGFYLARAGEVRKLAESDES